MATARPTPSGDNWFLPHSQLDASVTVELRSDVSLQVSGLEPQQRRVRLLQRQLRGTVQRPAGVLWTQRDHVGEVWVRRLARDTLMSRHILAAVALVATAAVGGAQSPTAAPIRSLLRFPRARRCRPRRRRQASRNSHSSRTATRAAATTASSCRPSIRSSSSRCSRRSRRLASTLGSNPVRAAERRRDPGRQRRQAAQRQLHPADQSADAGRRRSVLPVGRESRRREQHGSDEPASASPDCATISRRTLG